MVSTWLAAWGFKALSAFTIIDLIAASTNAFNGVVLARRPDHYQRWTIIGVILLAVLGGIGGGIVRDVLLNTVPAALTDPWYVIVCVLSALLALRVAFLGGPHFREGLFQFMTAFSLPWYAVVGAQAALAAKLPLVAVVLIGVVGPTAGRYFLDVTSLVPAIHFVRGEWFVGTAVFASVVYIVLYNLGVPLWPATLTTLVIAFTFRIVAVLLHWEEPEPWEPPAAQPAGSPHASLGAVLREKCIRSQETSAASQSDGRREASS